MSRLSSKPSPSLPPAIADNINNADTNDTELTVSALYCPFLLYSVRLCMRAVTNLSSLLVLCFQFRWGQSCSS